MTDSEILDFIENKIGADFSNISRYRNSVSFELFDQLFVVKICKNEQLFMQEILFEIYKSGIEEGKNQIKESFHQLMRID